MKKNNITDFIFVGLLVCAALSCKLFSGASATENGDMNSNSIAVKNASPPTPAPAAYCPSESIYVIELLGDKLKSYEGCTLTVHGTLLVLGSESVSLVGSYESADTLKEPLRYRDKTVSCSGDFSSKIYSDIGAKLSSLKLQGKFDKLPNVTVKGTVKTSLLGAGLGNYTGLGKCVMTDFYR